MSPPFRPTTPATLRRPLAPSEARLLEWPDPLVQATIVQCRKWMGAQQEDQKTPSSNTTPTHTLKYTVEVMYTRILNRTHTHVESELDGVDLEITATESTTTIPGLKGRLLFNSTYWWHHCMFARRYGLLALLYLILIHEGHVSNSNELMGPEMCSHWPCRRH